jgi:hypothetical protein
MTLVGQNIVGGGRERARGGHRGATTCTKDGKRHIC